MPADASTAQGCRRSMALPYLHAVLLAAVLLATCIGPGPHL